MAVAGQRVEDASIPVKAAAARPGRRAGTEDDDPDLVRSGPPRQPRGAAGDAAIWPLRRPLREDDQLDLGARNQESQRPGTERLVTDNLDHGNEMITVAGQERVIDPNWSSLFECRLAYGGPASMLTRWHRLDLRQLDFPPAGGQRSFRPRITR